MVGNERNDGKMNKGLTTQRRKTPCAHVEKTLQDGVSKGGRD